MAYHGKSKKYYDKYYTRKSWRKFGEFRFNTYSIGKKQKNQYNRSMRNGKHKLIEIKNSEWKKLKCCDLWNWY